MDGRDICMGLGYGMDGIFGMDEIGRWMINEWRGYKSWKAYMGWVLRMDGKFEMDGFI